MMMEIDNTLEKALVAKKLLAKFKDAYLNKWIAVAAKSTKPKTQEEAKEQIDELYSYMKKINLVLCMESYFNIKISMLIS